MADDYEVTRKVGKAHVLPTAPAYSFGGRHERQPADPGPGPGQYGPGWSMNSKGTGFGTASRRSLQGQAGPAGTDYLPNAAKVSPAKPAFSFGLKHRKDYHERAPGPGAYDPAVAAKHTKPSASAYSLSGRTEGDREAERRPGPAEYDPHFTPKEPHAASIKFRSSVAAGSSVGGPSPGPGEYDTPGSRSRSEGKSFGVSREVRCLDNGVPGPGCYGAPESPSAPRRASWSVGRASRDTGLRASLVPGPGTYSPNDPIVARPGGHSAASDSRSVPAYTFGGRIASARPPISPGPTDYGVPPDPGLVHKPVYSMKGPARREPAPRVPGPGAYEPDKADELVNATAPVHSIALRNEDMGIKDMKPGPGAYDRREPDGRIAVSLKFKNSSKPDNQDNPAPHDYADKDFRTFGQLYKAAEGQRGFTMRPRYREDRREEVPGPQYRVGCSTLGVAATPKVMKSKLNMTAVL